jgi:hypothetical protein
MAQFLVRARSRLRVAMAALIGGVSQSTHAKPPVAMATTQQGTMTQYRLPSQKTCRWEFKLPTLVSHPDSTPRPWLSQNNRGGKRFTNPV